MHKQRDYSTPNTVLTSKLIGDVNVQGKVCIIIDDMCDTMGTMLAAVNTLKTHGAKGVIIIATHGILSGPALKRINNCEDMIKVIVTNTLPQEHSKRECSKIKVVDITELLATTIKCLETGKSISELFN